ncbi:tRNA (GuanineN(7))methyltransferase, putative (macronuclear) [Tetrahymena thermophila SB210]|uniref:tRNA (GuanineN(7))methyltransferase, putative n=1 Tax=Tetrahymena thermophila (strain SB210) TaxID=312017 RepID=I7MHU8_TETTS|nr:tRNA (GuanineN(7))methyltransferase, putative [Tetrahymena thermophila SB210]EAR89910.3 tRNA (GuanineN(7))methyltransferase, putative [Tetrahymena thermophila SB210]|eukprot:XP_001010155.3 tRNA (GuanineN(7))methyltransferase, putative [Tetrahymena thermophila SB210]
MNRVVPQELNDSAMPMQTQEDIIDLSDVKQLKKPNLADLENFIQQTHPLSGNSRQYTRCETCSFETGRHSCLFGDTSEKSQVDKLGLTPTLYFRFVKNLAEWFLFFSILAAVPILFYMKAFTESSSEVKQFTATQKLVSTTLGSLVLDRTQCQYLLLGNKSSSSTTSQISDYTLSLQCSTGTLPTQSSMYYYGLVTSKSSGQTSDTCIFQDLSQIDQTCNQSVISNFQAIITPCFGQTSCQVAFDTSIFSSDSDCQSKAKKQKIFVSTICENSYYQVKWKFEKSQAVLIASVIDGAIMICFMYVLIRLKMSQNQTEKNVISNSVGVSYFTLEIKNLPQDFEVDELKFKLKKHFETQISQIVSKKESFGVYDIQVATPYNVVQSEKKLTNLQKKKLEQILSYCNKFSIAIQNNQLSMKMLNNHYNNLEKQEDRKIAMEKLTNIAKISSLIEKEKKIQKEQERSGQKKIISAFVTFQTMRNRDIAYYAMYQTYLDKFIESCLFCCKNKNDMRRFEYRLLEVKSAPAPEDIIWENFSISFCNRFIRIIFSTLITLTCMIGTLIFIVFVKNQNQKFLNKYPTVNCPSNSSSITQQQVVKDYESQVTKGLLECYCKINPLGRYNDNFTMSDGSTQQLCKNWFEDQALIIALPFLVVVVIIFINNIMQIIFTYLSKLEGYRYVSHQVSSRVAKIFIMQFMNTALIILIMNTKFNGVSNTTISMLLDGTFTDFNPLWFLQVGSTILLTMIFYIMMPYLNFIFQSLYICLRRYYDRKWSSNKNITRQSTQEKYESVYLSPNLLIEVRYAQIMNIIFVCFLYSSGLPLLIITTFLYLISTYYVDKFAMLRLCRKPPQFGKNLEDIIRNILWISIPLHCLLGIWMYGSPKMFPSSISNSILNSISSQVSQLESQINDYNNTDISKEFYSRAIKSQCIPQLIVLLFFLLYVLYLLIKKRIIIPLFNCICCCFNFAEDDLISKKNELQLIPYFAFVTKQDLKSNLKLLQNDLQECKNDNYKQILSDKYTLLRQQLNTRKSNNDKHFQLENLEKQRGVSCNLVGLYSYDIRVHPDYSHN